MAILKFSKAEKATKRLETRYIQELRKSYQESLDDIQKHIQKAYNKYGVDGKLTLADMKKMTTYDRKRVTRLERLEKLVNAELSALNRGQTQQMAGYLTNVYEENYKLSGALINTIAAQNISFELMDRKAIYNSAIAPMGKIAIEENAVAVRQNIKRAITQSIVQSEGIPEMSNKIKDTMETSANRATRIARTETTGIMGKARLEAFRESERNGIKIVKIWVAANQPGRTRNSHRNLNGEERPIDEPFSNGLMEPGDQSGPASEVVNCRCTMAARVIKD